MKNILGELRSRQQKSRTAKIKHEHIITVPQLKHRYRETNVNEDEEKWLSFKGGFYNVINSNSLRYWHLLDNR